MAGLPAPVFARVVALAAALCSGHACAEQYESDRMATGESIKVECEGPSVIETPCKLQIVKSGQAAGGVRFVVNRPHDFPDLLGAAAKKKLSAPQEGDYLLSQEGVRVLTALDLRQCFSSDEMGSLLAICPDKIIPPQAITMMMRGLCDRCEFEPIVLWKK